MLLTFATFAIASWATSTVTVQAGSVPPAGQLPPAVAEVTVLARIWLPVSGLFTVTENVITADAPTARFPAQVRLGLAKVTVPAVAAAPVL